MSVQSYIGLLFLVAGIGLEQFSLYRKKISQQQRKCNDSKATLLLYFSTGVCCEITSLFLLPFTTYLISLSLHLVFFTYFAFKYPPTLHFKIASLLYCLSFCLQLLESDNARSSSVRTMGLGFLFTIFVFASAAAVLSRYPRHKIAKAALSSGFGTVICVCMREFVEMTYATLEDVYPSVWQIFCTMVLLVCSLLAQSTLGGGLMGKFEVHQVYAAYLMVNLVCGIIAVQLFCDEPINKLGFVSLVLSVIGSTVLSSENYSEKSLLFQGVTE